MEGIGSVRARRAAIVLLSLLLGACVQDTGGGTTVTLTFVSYGGVYQRAQADAWLRPYEQSHPGVRIVQDEPTDFARLRAMVESGRVRWDVVAVTGDFGLDRDAGLLEPIDCAVVPCADLQPDLFPTTGYRVPNLVYSTVLAYRTDRYRDRQPAGYADLFDLRAFPGKRGCHDDPAGGMLEIALLADGVPPERLYPLDVARAFAKLDSIKPACVWWTTGAQSAQLLADGEVGMAVAWNGRVHDIERDGAPVRVSWDEHLLKADYYVVPRGSRHVQEAMELIAWMTSAEHAAEVTRLLPYPPANARAVARVDPAMAPELPTSHPASAVAFDDRWWERNREEVYVRWQRWIRS